MKAQFYFEGNLTDSKELARAFLQTKNDDDWIAKEDWGTWFGQQREEGRLTLEFGKAQTEDAWNRHLDTIRSKEQERLEQQFQKDYPGKKNRTKRRQIRKSEEYLAACAEKILEAVEEENKKKDQLLGGLVETAKRQQWNKGLAEGWNQVKLHNQSIQARNLNAVEAFLLEHREEILEQLKEAVGTWLRSYGLWMIWGDSFFDDKGYLLPGDSFFIYEFEYGYDDVPVTSENLEEFLRLLKHPFRAQGIFAEVWNADGDIPAVDFLLSFVREQFGFTEELLKDMKDDLLDMAVEFYNNEIEYEEVDESWILSCLKENPGYKCLLKEKLEREEKRNRLKNDLLTAMPERYPDLYPGAKAMHRKFVLHIGPTNSGKTYSAMEALRKAGEGIYLAPLRLLAFEQYEALNRDGYPASLVTGEEQKLVDGARIQASTVEMMNPNAFYRFAVIDEAQMLGDPDRGGAWTAAILGLRAPEIHVCLAPEAEGRIRKLIEECGDAYEIIRHKRSTRLALDPEPFRFPKSVEKGDALIVFSKRNVHAVAYELRSRGVKCSILYGNLPYDVRQSEAQKFAEGETDVVVATDAIGMGLNLPIRRVVFLELEKFDGKRRRRLRPEEVRQIAGRAGRKGIVEQGFYTAEGREREVQELYGKPTSPVETAMIGFPPSLLGLEGTFTEILSEWEQLSAVEGYRQADTEDLKALASLVEPLTDDKEFVYRCVTIPVRPDSEEQDVWLQLVKRELAGEPFQWEPYRKTWPVEASRKLDILESRHRLCDVCYAFAVRFGHLDAVEPVLEYKAGLSEAIREELSSHGLTPKRCRNCGKVLRWNYPYGLCQDCYGQRSWNWERYW